MISALRVNAPAPVRSSYINTPPEATPHGEPGHDWQAHTFDRLRWAHGENRARAIAMGIDPATNADLKAWRELGR